MDEITIGDKTYISSKQAAKITGYAKDYVGQLCREGRVEARLVGRNWYVLDSAIREHRFGKEEEPAASPVISEAQEPLDRSSAWKRPQYEAEVPVLVPSFSGKAAETVGAPAIADMQSAWREWFQDRQPSANEAFANLSESEVPVEEVVPTSSTSETAIQSDEPTLDSFYEEEVIVSRIQASEAQPAGNEVPETDDFAESVDIRRIYATKPVEVEIKPRTVPPAVSRRSIQVDRSMTSTSVGAGVVRAMFVVLSVGVALVALIGTGHADQYLAGTSLDFGVQKQIIDFLGGKSVYESSL